MFQKILERRKLRAEKIAQAREGFTSWQEISRSAGWKAYEEKINQKIEYIKNQMDNNTSLLGGDLKNLQLALQIWKQVKNIPKELLENAKGGEEKYVSRFRA